MFIELLFKSLWPHTYKLNNVEIATGKATQNCSLLFYSIYLSTINIPI